MWKNPLGSVVLATLSVTLKNKNGASSSVVCAESATAVDTTPGLSGVGTDDGALHFLALGDWGGYYEYPYTMEAQIATADAMASVAAEKGSAFVLALGDNFYHRGVHNVEDQRFQSTYKDVYHHPELQIPWYVLAGNHDHKGNVTAQLEFHNIDPHWNFPGLNHRVVKEFKTGGPATSDADADSGGNSMTVEVLLVDTVQLAGMHHHDFAYEQGYFDPLPGPSDVSVSLTNRHWLKHHLERSTADYLLVAGHYPVYSACEHGNTKHLINKLEPLLKEYGVTAYLSGHDHCQEHIVHDEVNYLLTGTGDECCYEAKKIRHLPEEATLAYLLAWDDDGEYNPTDAEGGFMSFEAGSEKMTVRVHDDDGTVLYTTDLPPRNRRLAELKKEATVDRLAEEEDVVPDFL